MRSRRTRSGGFTLIEAALVIIIIGTGVVAMMELMATGTRANSESAERVTALTLARNVREHALTLSYDQARALSGRTFSPPIDADGAALSGFDGWQQTVQVQPVDPADLLTNVSVAAPSAVRVSVHAVRSGHQKATLSWYQFRMVP